MTGLKPITKDYRQTGPFNSLINLHAAVDDFTFATKGGDILSVLKVRGIDYEGKDPAQIDLECRRLQYALRILEGCQVYQYYFKDECSPIPFRRYPEAPVLDQAIKNRLRFFSTKAAALREIDIYYVVVREAAASLIHTKCWPHFLLQPYHSLREAFSAEARITALNHAAKQACERFREQILSFAVQLKDSAQPVLLNKHDAFHVFRRLLNFDRVKAAVALKYDSFVDYQACGSTLECYRDHLKLDDHYIKVLTLKEPPAHTFADLLRPAAEIPSHCIVTSFWRPENNDVVRRAIQSKRRHFYQSKSSIFNYLNAGSTGPKDMLIDDSAVGQVYALGQCLEELNANGHAFGRYSLSVIISDTNFERVKQSAAECFKIFAAHDAQLIEERYNTLNAYLAALPGGQLFNRRTMWLSSTNYADLSFLFKLATGESTNSHLRAEYLAVLETNHRTPYFLNLHYQDVGHTLILGSTGSGKSFLLNFLITHAQKYDPRVFIFDLGGSYRKLTRLAGGSHLSIGAADWPFSINPFVLPPTPDNLHFLFLLILVLAGSNGYVPTADDEKDLFDQIKNLYEVDESQRRLSTLVNILGRSLRRELQKWVVPGPYASLFDNAEDTLTFSRFQTFDFEGMIKSPMLEPLLFYILHRATVAVVSESEAGVFKLFCLDEVWRFLQHPTIRQYALEALKTWRKKNAAMILATQSTDDLIQSEMLNVVVESCPTKLFLANPDMNQNAYRAIFHLTETESELIANLVPKRQFLLKRPDLAKVLNLEVDPQGYWLYANDPHDEHTQAYSDPRGLPENINIPARSSK